MQSSVLLNNGVKMPILGLGIYAPGEKNEVRNAVTTALEVGYRLLDTASIYQNEEEVGQGFKDSGLVREEVFITSKVWRDEQGYNKTLRAYDKSLKRLQTDYIDLYLIHWPVRKDLKETWQALEKLYEEKRVRAIGISNYYEPHLKELFEYANVIPAVNQFEFSPFLYLPNVVNFCIHHKIQPEGYAPLVRGEKAQHPVLVDIAKKHRKSTYQVLIRWSMQHQVVTIPKSVNPERIKANFDVWDFELTPMEMDALNQLHDGTRVADDPMTYL
ncbi:aldo/keto reductase [Telluribacter sp. SYSU D00476]|uniref:aldo/keto reductase n=1 Tax=Telluribacter sp. SYSU D00476 TaxID=2811430 RepID=UPI001FF51303|nr:aldo/keto reductase [Telluribacter sp. SYSU D00476]